MLGEIGVRGASEEGELPEEGVEGIATGRDTAI
jgi:hypothetical protein